MDSADIVDVLQMVEISSDWRDSFWWPPLQLILIMVVGMWLYWEFCSDGTHN